MMLLFMLLVLSLGGCIASDICEACTDYQHQRPIEFERCGSWQEDYIHLHQQILAGECPPRYLVAVAVQGGLADRIVGIITEFYFALLTGRAFQITNAHQALPRFEGAFEAPFINWTRHINDPLTLTEHLKLTYGGVRHYEVGLIENGRAGMRCRCLHLRLTHRNFPLCLLYVLSQGPREMPDEILANTSDIWSMYLVNDRAANEFYGTSDLRQIPEGHADVSTLFVTSNRGRVFQLFDNPHHSKVHCD
jgi:hypothetical protein